jgi:hypothetical protein
MSFSRSGDTTRLQRCVLPKRRKTLYRDVLASPAARTKATRHKTSAKANAKAFRLRGSTRLMVLFANQTYKPLALPIYYSVSTRYSRTGTGTTRLLSGLLLRELVSGLKR